MARVPPEPEPVLPGLWAIAIPATDNNPVSYTINYVFETDTGIALVDTSWGTEDNYRALVGELAKLGGTVCDIDALLITHMHPDHFGLVPRLMSENRRTRLYMHAQDLMLVDHRGGELRERSQPGWLALMTSIGGPDNLGLTERPSPGARIGPEHAHRAIEVGDEDVIDVAPWRLRALWTPGHTPGHLCLFVERHGLLLSGDHLLPTITPHVAQMSKPGADILGGYLDSLRKYQALAIEQVLPAHQYRFAGYRQRVDEILAHHDNRCRILESSIENNPGKTGYQLASALDWHYAIDSMSGLQRRLAVKETFAHLIHLKAHGRLREQPGPPSTWWPTS